MNIYKSDLLSLFASCYVNMVQLNNPEEQLWTPLLIPPLRLPQSQFVKIFFLYEIKGIGINKISNTTARF